MSGAEARAAQPRRWPRRLGRAGGALLLAGAALYGCWRGYRASAGEPSVLLDETWHEGTRVLDRQGRLLRELPGPSGNRGRTTALAAMGERVTLATIVSEDRGFYEHEGVSPLAVARAATQNVRHGRLVSGASTITQQLVKLLDHEGKPHARGLADKLREAARAQNLEDVASKDAILEAYLNRLSYGHGLVGPEAAARGYFGVRATELSWARAAFLAVLPRAPSFLDPFSHPDRVLVRQRALLAALHEEGVLDAASLARALAEGVVPRAPERPFLAPHFVEALRRKLGDEEVGAAIVTTLDLDLQRDTEGMVETHLAAIEDRGARDAAVLVLDNATGDVLAYVGSADFSNERIHGQVDMIQALRQPGSTLKPFFYELAFERGHDGAEMLADVPTTFGETSRRTYAPLNFTGTFEGPVSAREALAGSLNVPVVRLLAEIGPADALARLRELGFSSLDRDASHYGLSLALGSGEVRLHELGAAYMTLARGGEAVPLRMRAGDAAPPARGAAGDGTPPPGGDARPPAERTASGRRVMPPEMAASIAEILSDPLARVRGLHGQGPFDLGFPVAVKTGTSAGYRDALCAGFTRERTVVVWVGNADGAPAHELTGALGAGPLFADVMRRAMGDVPARAPLYDPTLLEEAEVCPLSGRRPGEACPDRAHRKFARGHTPKEACAVHLRVTAAEGESGRAPWRCAPRGEQTIALLPVVFADWLRGEAPGAPGKDPLGIPWYAAGSVHGCTVSTGEPQVVQITSPAPGSVFVVSNRPAGTRRAIEVRASVRGGGGRQPPAVDFFLDGKAVARSAWPYTARINPDPGEHELVAFPANPDEPAQARPARFSVW